MSFSTAAKKVNILLVGLLLLSFAGNGQDVKYKTITVDPYMSVSNSAFFKVLTIKSPDCYADYIEEFDFAWGYSYKLKIKIKKLKSPPMDGSDTEYSLEKIISKTKVPDSYQFNMRLENELYLGPGEQASTFTVINDSTYSYFQKIEIEVPSTLKNQFSQIIDNNQSKIGLFSFINENKIRLIKIE